MCSLASNCLLAFGRFFFLFDYSFLSCVVIRWRNATSLTSECVDRGEKCDKRRCGQRWRRLRGKTKSLYQINFPLLSAKMLSVQNFLLCKSEWICYFFHLCFSSRCATLALCCFFFGFRCSNTKVFVYWSAKNSMSAMRRRNELNE